MIIVNRNGTEMPQDPFAHSDDVSCPNENFFSTKNVSSTEFCFHWINRDDDAIGSFFRHFAFSIFYLEEPDIIDIIENVFILILNYI